MAKNPRIEAAQAAALKMALGTNNSSNSNPTVVIPAAATSNPPGTTVDGQTSAPAPVPAATPAPAATATPAPAVSAPSTATASTTPPAATTEPTATAASGPSVTLDASYIPSFLAEPPPAPAPAAAPAPTVTTPAPAADGDKEINFANLRKAKESLEQKLSQVFDGEGKVKPEFIKTLNIETPEVAQLQRERDDALDRVAKIDLQADPRWQVKYSAQENAALNSVVKFAKDYDVKPEDVKGALKLSLRERTKFFQEHMPEALAMIAPHLATLDQIQAQKEADIANARQVSQQIETQTATAREKAIVQARQTIGSQVIRELGQAGVYVFNERPGNAEWNKGVADARQRFSDLLATNDVMAHSRAMALGVAAPVFLAHLKAQDKLITELRTQLKLHGGAGATIATGSTAQSASGPIDTSKMTAKDMAKMAVANMRKS